MSNKITIRANKGKTKTSYQCYFSASNETYWTKSFESQEKAFLAAIKKQKIVLGNASGEAFYGRNFSYFLDSFLEESTTKNKQSYKNDVTNIERYIKPQLGHLPIDEITPDDILCFQEGLSKQPTCFGLDEEEIRSLKKQGWSISKIAKHTNLTRDTVAKYLKTDCNRLKDSTINRIIALIKSVFTNAISKRIISSSPAAHVAQLSEEEVKIEFWMPVHIPTLRGHSLRFSVDGKFQGCCRVDLRYFFAT